MTSANQTINDLHAAYCAATGLDIRLAYDRESDWMLFVHDGFTKEDLLCVVAWLKREIRAGKRWTSSLYFRNLIKQLDRFEEDLSCAKAALRKPEPTARDKALEQLRPTAPNQTSTVTSTAKQVHEVSAKALAMLRECKASL